MSEPMSAVEARAEAIRRIEKARAEGSEILDFGDLPLASLPEELSGLAGLACLAELNLWGCGGVADLSPLAGLASLSELNLSFCRGAKDLSPLAGIASLSELNLSDCDGVADLSPLAGLASLSEL